MRPRHRLRSQDKLAARGGGFHHVIGTGNGSIMRVVAGLMAQGSLKAVIDKRYSLVRAKEAMQHMESGRAAGKIVIDIAPLDGPGEDPELREGGPE